MAVDLVPDIANALLSCLCGAVNQAPDPPEQCCLRIGTQVTHDADLITDLCCTGLAYVRLGNLFPTTAFPNPDTTRQAITNCGIVSWGVELVAGIIRCAPVGDENGNMPTCEDWTAAAVQNFYDAQSLRRMVCCFVTSVRTISLMEGMSVIVGTQTQGDPLGGCVERSVNLTVQIPNCDC
jgi:hypothetical protein